MFVCVFLSLFLWFGLAFAVGFALVWTAPPGSFQTTPREYPKRPPEIFQNDPPGPFKMLPQNAADPVARGCRRPCKTTTPPIYHARGKCRRRRLKTTTPPVHPARRKCRRPPPGVSHATGPHLIWTLIV